MLRKKNFLLLLVLFLLINSYLLAEKDIYYFHGLEGRENWEKEIHFLNLDNQPIDLNFKTFFKNKLSASYSPEIPFSFYKQGAFSLSEILAKSITENISYLKTEFRQKKIIAFEVLKSFEDSKIEIASSYGNNSSDYTFPILSLSSDNYNNFIILNENNYSVNIEISILNTINQEVIFSKKLKLIPHSPKYLTINELLDFYEDAFPRERILIKIKAEDLIKIFPVFGLSCNKEYQNDGGMYLPIIKFDKNSNWNDIFLYNSQNIPINLEIEGYDYFCNPLGTLFYETIYPNKVKSINLSILDETLLYDSLFFVKIKAEKNIISCLIYEDKNKRNFNIIKSFSFSPHSSELTKENETSSKNYNQTSQIRVEVLDDKLGILEGRVPNITDRGNNEIDAELEIFNTINLWLQQKSISYKTGENGKEPFIRFDQMLRNKNSNSTFLASLGFIPPKGNGKIMYIGRFTDIGQEIRIRFDLSPESMLINLFDPILSYLVKINTTTLVKISQLSEDLLNIPSVYKAFENFSAFISEKSPLKRAWYLNLIIYNIWETFTNPEYKNKLIEALLPIISLTAEMLIPIIPEIIKAFKANASSWVYAIQTTFGGQRYPEICFSSVKVPQKDNAPFISSINPTIVEQGNFTIRIFGENFNSYSKVIIYSETGNIPKGYLHILDSVGNNELIASGKSRPPGKYFISVQNQNNLESNKKSLTIRSKTENNIPNAPSNLRAEAISTRQIELNWQDNSNNEDGFIIERKSENESSWLQVRTIGANITFFKDDLLSPNTKYYYRIKAFNSYGYSLYSNEDSAKTLPISNPPPSIDYINPSAVKKGEFVIEIYGNNFDKKCQVLLYYEPDGHFVGYLQIQNWTLNKLNVKGKINYEGDYLLLVQNSDTQTSNKVKLIVISLAEEDNADLTPSTKNITVSTGQKFNFSITAKNTGKTTWTANENYYLGWLSGYESFPNNSNFTLMKLGQSENIAPNGSKKWNIEGIQAPNAPGTYTIVWRMVREGVHWFGNTATILVEVKGNQSPVAKFSMSAQGKTVYENQTLNLTVSAGGKATVNFSAQRSYDPDGSIASYEWKISGTKVSSSRDFSFDLGKGTHDIYLTVTDYKGATDSVAGTVEVKEEITPITVNLNVPFKAQVPPGNWAETKNCGQTSYLMVSCYYNGTAPNEQGIKEIDDWLYQRYGDPINDYNGSFMTTSKIVTLAREYGGFEDSNAYSGWSVSNIENELNNGYPVIVAVRLNMSSDPSVLGHFMVIRGIDKNYVYVNDPGHSLESEKGKNYAYSRSAFDASWSTENRACVTIHPAEHTITTPNTPSGPSSGDVNKLYTYFTGGSSCSQGHSVEYRFDWGDGVHSSWSSSTSASHSWSNAGTYTVKAQARCSVNNDIVSDWSSGKTVTISAVESPEIWHSPSSMSFAATEGGSNPSSQTLQVKNSGGGTLSYSITDDAEWLSVSPTSGSSTGGTNDHTVSVDISGMSAKTYNATITITASGASNSPQTVSVSLTINPASHTVTTPDTPSGPSSGEVNKSYTYSTGGSSCSQGHSVEYRFDWGDGTYSSWSSSTSASYFWSSAGTYTVKAQARCSVNHDIVSDWSSGKKVTINALPHIDSINPSQVVAGTFDLEIHGSNFDSGAVDQIYWKATGAYVRQGEVLSRSSTLLKVREYMSGATAGTYVVKVKNSDGKLSNGVDLTITSTPDPLVSISPSSGNAGTKFDAPGSHFSAYGKAELHLKKPDGSEFSPLEKDVDKNGNYSHTIDSTGFSEGTYYY